jgi:hypothetical protein
MWAVYAALARFYYLVYGPVCLLDRGPYISFCSESSLSKEEATTAIIILIKRGEIKGEPCQVSGK